MAIYWVFVLSLNLGVMIIKIPLLMALLYMGYDMKELLYPLIYYLNYIFLPLAGYLTLRLIPSFFLSRLENYNKNTKKEKKIVSYMYNDLRIGVFWAFFIFLSPVAFILGFVFGLIIELFPELFVGMRYTEIQRNYASVMRFFIPFIAYLTLRLWPIFFVEQLREWNKPRLNRNSN